MSAQDTPQIYLVAPAHAGQSDLADRVAAALDAAPVACLRFDAAGMVEDDIARAADRLREVAHARDVPLVIGDHYRLAPKLGLDGVHLTDGARHVREARKALGADAIVGAFAGTSRHDGINAGEMGADYVAFGPVAATDLGDGRIADADLFAWWSEMIEVPVVADGGFTRELAATLAPVTDFVALGPEIWTDPAGPAAALADYARILSGK